MFHWKAQTGNHLFTVVADAQGSQVDEADETNNTKTVALYPDQIYFPDLVAEDVQLSVDPAQAVAWGEPISISATVRNTGTAAAGAFRVSFYVDGTYFGYAVANNGLAFAAGANEIQLSVPWTPTEGSHTIEARVDDPISHVVELNKSNNSFTLHVPALNFGYGDLSVREIQVWPDNGVLIYPELLQISANVANLSTVSVNHPFDVRFYVGDTYVGSQRVQSLDGSKDCWVSIQAAVTSGVQSIRVVADEAGEIHEQSTQNNTCVLPNVPIVVAYADLVVQSVTWPSTVTYGDTVQLAVRIANVGTAPTYCAVHRRGVVGRRTPGFVP